MRDKIRDIVIKIVAGSIDMSKGIDDIEALKSNSFFIKDKGFEITLRPSTFVPIGEGVLMLNYKDMPKK